MSPTPWPKPPVQPKRAPKKLTAKQGRLFPERRDREYTRWVRQENPCLLRGKLLIGIVGLRDTPVGEVWRHICWGPREAAHVGQHVATGAPDFASVVCLCRAAHRFYDEHRSDWLAVTGFSAGDMASAASGLALRFIESGGKSV